MDIKLQSNENLYITIKSGAVITALDNIETLDSFYTADKYGYAGYTSGQPSSFKLGVSASGTRIEVTSTTVTLTVT